MARHLTPEQVISVIADVEAYMLGDPRRKVVGDKLVSILFNSTGLSLEGFAGTRIVRAVPMEKGEVLPNSLSRISYNPKPKLNRANTPERAVFYGQPVTPLGYDALFPEIPEIKVGTVLAMSTWVSTVAFRLLTCGFVDCPGEVGGPRLSASELVLKNFLHEKFREKFRCDFPHNYWITSEVAEFFYQWESPLAAPNAGIAYASVHDETVFNWAVKGDFIDANFNPLKVEIVEITNVEIKGIGNKKYKFETLATTERFENQSICW